MILRKPLPLLVDPQWSDKSLRGSNMGCPCSFSPLRLLFQGSQRSLSWWRQSEAQGFHPDGGIRGSGDGGSTPATTRDSRKHPSSVDVVALYVIDILYTLAEMLIQHDSTLFHLEFRKAFKIHTLGGATILEGEHSPHSRQLFLLVKDEIFHYFHKIFRTNAYKCGLFHASHRKNSGYRKHARDGRWVSKNSTNRR